MKRIAGAVVGLVIVAGLGVAAHAQDPLEVSAGKYSKLFENEKVRVLDLRIKPGESIPMHSHPDHFVYMISGGTFKLTHPDGTTVEAKGETGQVLWIPAESHSAVNAGTTEIHAIVNELKS